MLTHLPSIITTSIIILTDSFHKYKPVPNRQDLPALFLTLILVQVTHPNSQICYYGNYQDDYLDLTQKFYGSLSEKDHLEVTDHGTSSLTTTSPLDYIKKTTKLCSIMIIQQSSFNLTNYNLPTSLQETLSVDHHCCNTL